MHERGTIIMLRVAPFPLVSHTLAYILGYARALVIGKLRVRRRPFITFTDSRLLEC